MKPLQYALVAYVKNELARFMEELRHEIHPALGHSDAHLSILPPRPLQGSERQVLDRLAKLCSSVAPFEVTLGPVESFHPVTPTAYLRVQDAAPMLALHDRLNTAELACSEQWSYVPHLTIVKLADESRLPAVLELSRRRWAAYRGSRRARVAELTFVREGEGNRWVDLAPVQLGGGSAPQPRD
jgi:2'-5' RNA ligase